MVCDGPQTQNLHKRGTQKQHDWRANCAILAARQSAVNEGQANEFNGGSCNELGVSPLAKRD
jgi:hypothetical protein